MSARRPNRPDRPILHGLPTELAVYRGPGNRSPLDGLVRQVLPVNELESATPEPISPTRLSELLWQDYAREPAIPDYPPVLGFGYRIPIIPRRELPTTSNLELLDLALSPEARNRALLHNLLKAAEADRKRTARNESMSVEARQGELEKARAAQETGANEATPPMVISQGTRNQTPKPKAFNVSPPTNAPVDETAMLGALKFDPAGPSERQLIILHPIDALRARKAAEESHQAAASRFPHLRRHNDPGDAFRHALWSYKLTRLLGPERAKEFTDSHEVSHPNSRGERLMDLYNNQAGRRLVMDPANQQKPDEAVVLEALKRGELRQKQFPILPGTELASPTRPVTSHY